MSHEESHLSEEELVLAADGELSPERAAQVRLHLASCQECRARTAAFEGAIADFVDVHRAGLDPQLPPIAGPRALLKARLAEQRNEPRWIPWGIYWRTAAGFCAVLLVAVLAGRMLRESGSRREAAWLGNSPAPLNSLTPGATVPVRLDQVCGPAYEERPPVIPASLQRQVFQEYGIPNARPDAYEVDFLITPELGGSNNIRNLWPQPYGATIWNAHVKDELEDRLHRLVCEGKLDLATAQRDISRDWIGAYKKYFHTDRPVPDGVRSLE